MLYRSRRLKAYFGSARSMYDKITASYGITDKTGDRVAGVLRKRPTKVIIYIDVLLEGRRLKDV